jgi:inositol 3-alpha-galactosyltransferase
MRRHHNVLAATLLLLGIIYLCTQREDKLLDQTSFHVSSEAHGVLYTDHRNGNDPNTAAPPFAAPFPSESDFANPDANEQSFVDLGKHTESQSHDERPSEDGIAIPLAQSQLPQQGSDNDPSPSKLEYSFQNDLNLDLPVSALHRFSTYAPLNHVADKTKSKPYAFATFMATRNPSLRDPYFLAIHSLIHRILWAPRTRTQKNYPFIVFVADFVTTEQRALLRGAGAIVRDLAPLEWYCNAPGVQRRWNDLFAKLNMWSEADFERILFLDADAFPLANIDHIFDSAPVQNCIEEKLALDDFLPDQTSVCEAYVLAGVPQAPFSKDAPNINVGSMLFKPSLRMHQRLVQNYQKIDHYDCAMAEQGFLNWQFGPGSAYPPTRLERQWGGFFPTDEDEGKLKIVHEKLWAVEHGWLGKEWERGWEEMSTWYASEKFVELRDKEDL